MKIVVSGRKITVTQFDSALAVRTNAVRLRGGNARDALVVFEEQLIRALLATADALAVLSDMEGAHIELPDGRKLMLDLRVKVVS